MNKTKCDALKLEVIIKILKLSRKLTDLKIPIMGHIGFTPQFKKNLKLREKLITKLKNY